MFNMQSIKSAAIATAKFVGHTAVSIAVVAAGVTAAHVAVAKIIKKD